MHVPLPGQYVPLCDEDGYYKPTQCHGSLGQCWCVDRYGNEVMGSRTSGVADCGRKGYIFNDFSKHRKGSRESHSLVQAFNEDILLPKNIGYMGGGGSDKKESLLAHEKPASIINGMA